MKQMARGNKGSYQFLHKYVIPKLNYVVYTYRLHVDDMFYEMPVMASRGLVMVLLSLFILLHYFYLLFLISSYHSILGNGLGSRPEKVA